jgi:hypothetical protein
MEHRTLFFILIVLVLVLAVVVWAWCIFRNIRSGTVGAYDDDIYDEDDAEDITGAADEQNKPAVVYGVFEEKGGNGVVSGYGRIEKKEFNDLTVNGSVRLDGVKVKKTLYVNGHVKGWNVSANNVEVNGGLMLTDSDVKRLIVHNAKVSGQNPNIQLFSTKCEKIELDDKSAKESDFVLIKEKGAPLPRGVPGKSSGKKMPAKAK